MTFLWGMIAGATALWSLLSADSSPSWLTLLFVAALVWAILSDRKVARQTAEEKRELACLRAEVDRLQAKLRSAPSEQVVNTLQLQLAAAVARCR